jgi:hypothetical protein
LQVERSISKKIAAAPWNACFVNHCRLAVSDTWSLRRAAFATRVRKKRVTNRQRFRMGYVNHVIPVQISGQKGDHMSRQWYCHIGGQQSGPVSTDELGHMAQAGILEPTDLIWTEGMEAWEPASTSQGLFPSTDSTEPAPAAAMIAPAKPVAEKSIPWHQRRVVRVIFGCCIAFLGVSRLLRGILLLTGVVGGYGTQLTFNHGELYYTASVKADDAQRLGSYLVKEKFFDGHRISVQLTKENGTYQSRMVTQPKALEDKGYMQIAGQFAGEMSQHVFNGAKVEIHLCDDHLKTVKVIPEASKAKQSV